MSISVIPPSAHFLWRIAHGALVLVKMAWATLDKGPGVAQASAHLIESYEGRASLPKSASVGLQGYF